jgi:zinc transport system substrate-binding protein
MPSRHALAISRALAGVALCAAAVGCGRAPEQRPTATSTGSPTLRVVVCVGPQAFLAKRVGGEHVAVTTLVGPGQSPHTYEPTPRQVLDLEESDVYLEVGMPFEETLLAKAREARPALHVVDTREGITLRRMEAHEEESDGEVHGGHESAVREAELDPHVWLAPKLAARQAATVRDAFIALDGAHEADYRANAQALVDDLTEVDAEIAKALAPLRGREMLVFHPAFGYFADAYGLRQVPIEAQGKEPSARELAALIDQARQRGIRVVFVQRQFPTAAAEAVADSIGGAVVPLDDLAEDYLTNLRAVAKAVREGVGDGGG